MLEWIRSGAVQALDQPQEDSEQQPVFRIVPCVFEAAKQVHSENPKGLDVYTPVLTAVHHSRWWDLSNCMVSWHWERYLEYSFWSGVPWILPVWWSAHRTARTENSAGLCFFSVVRHLCFIDWTGVSKDRKSGSSSSWQTDLCLTKYGTLSEEPRKLNRV